jgi:hypothetical protein
VFQCILIIVLADDDKPKSQFTVWERREI